MRKVLQINTVVNSGSTGRIAEEIGQAVINNGWESYIAFGRNIGNSKSHLIKIGSNFDVIMHGLETRFFDRQGLGSAMSTKYLIQQIEMINPDIIHLHNIHGYYLNIRLFFEFLQSANIPVVWTLHDCWAMTGHCVYFDFVSCEKWKTLCYSCPQIGTYPSSLFLDRSTKNYLLKKKIFTSIDNLTLVPVSEWLKNIVNQSFLHGYNSILINNGIDVDFFTPMDTLDIKRKMGIDNFFLLLGVASIWSKRKGLDDILLLSSYLSEDIKIILVGLDNKQIRKLPPNIIGLNRTDNIKQLAELYSVADLFINPTWEDNFPTTNLESLACGTPVLSYKTGGSIESIDVDTGFYVEKGDINALLEVIELVKEKGKSYYSKACRNRAVKLYDKNKRYNEYIQLYNRILIRNKTKDLHE